MADSLSERTGDSDVCEMQVKVCYSHHDFAAGTEHSQSTQAPHSKSDRLLHPDSKCQPAEEMRQDTAASMKARRVSMSNGAGL
jgi:hypothetical protein